MTGFIVKGIDGRGGTQWIGPMLEHGIRDVGERHQAEVFADFYDAQAAIASVPLDFERAGFIFTVEPSGCA